MKTASLVLLFLAALGQTDAANKLLMLMMDGFRWDYVQDDMPGFKAIMSGGVKAEYTTPEFPTVTYTNWMSLLSGTHPETHGLINNYIYDEKEDAYLLLRHATKDIDWASAAPIYTNAVANTLSVYMYYWDVCQIAVSGLKPQFCAPGIYSPGPTLDQFESGLNDGIANLKNGSADFAAVYLELLDVHGHFYGPHSAPIKRSVRSIDAIVSKVIQQTQPSNNAASDKDEEEEGINVVLVTDHGMTNVSPERAVNISETLEPGDVNVTLVSPPITFIWPNENKLEMVYNKLKTMHPNVTAYLKSELPERWYLKNHHRVPPITLVADLGWSMIDAKYGYPTHNNYTYLPGPNPLLGYHGYDNTNSDMRGVFMAIGPDFKKGYSQPGFPIIDAYLILNKVLGITPMPNNATWSHVMNMLRSTKDVDDGATYITFSFFLCIIATLIHIL